MIPLQYDGIGKALYVYRSRELDHKWILDNELLTGNIVLDLGANIGYYAIMEAKKVGSFGKIYGIEPDPRNIEFLKKNINLNKIDNIFEFEQGAISNKNGKSEFILSSKTNLSALSNGENQNNFDSVNVQKYDFGEYLKNKKRIDLVRMDIEGHEIEVFDSWGGELSKKHFEEFSLPYLVKIASCVKKRIARAAENNNSKFVC